MAGFRPPAPEGGGFFIGEDEKAELISQSYVFPVSDVKNGATQFGPKFTVTVDVDGEERGLNFSSDDGSSRAGLLFSLQDYMATETDQEPTYIRLVKVQTSKGRPFIQVVVVDENGIEIAPVEE